jgi:hypothetical protein
MRAVENRACNALKAAVVLKAADALRTVAVPTTDTVSTPCAVLTTGAVSKADAVSTTDTALATDGVLQVGGAAKRGGAAKAGSGMCGGAMGEVMPAPARRVAFGFFSWLFVKRMTARKDVDFRWRKAGTGRAIARLSQCAVHGLFSSGPLIRWRIVDAGPRVSASCRWVAGPVPGDRGAWAGGRASAWPAPERPETPEPPRILVPPGSHLPPAM